ncbi:hypothetical protein GCM10010407_10100 [Rarobacter incanus]
MISFMIAGIALFSVFKQELIETNGLDAGAVPLAMSIYLFTMAFGGIFSGRIADKYGAVPLMYGGAVAYGLGWFLTGNVHSTGQLYLVFGLLAGLGVGAVYNPTIAVTLR